jgi:hypothetical protein
VNSGEFALHCTKTQHSRKKHKNIASAEPTVTPQFLWVPCIKTLSLFITKHYITDFKKKKTAATA